MASTAPVLTSLRYYEDLRGNASWIDRAEGSNLDILHFNHTTHPVAICHISFISEYLTSGTPNTQRYEDSFAVALAVHHLNTGGGPLVDRVSQTVLQSCPHIKFTLEFNDVGIDTGVGLKAVIEQTDRIVPQQKRPCAFVGHYRSSMSIPTSMISGLRGYPQISGTSTSPTLDDKSSYPLFARMVGSDKDNALPVLQFFRNTLGVKHLAVLHMNEAYGIAYAQGLREAVRLHYPDVAVVAVSLPYQDVDDTAIREAVESLKLTRFRYFFAIIFDVFDSVMEEAYRQGITGKEDYAWFFSDSLEPSVVLDRTFERNSVLHQAYQGAGLITFAAGTAALKQSFAQEMANLSNNPLDLDYIAHQTPPNPTLQEEYFLKPVQSDKSAFTYDATISLGLSACRAASSSNLTLAGSDHYKALIEQVFSGVSGTVILNQVGSRTSTYYSVYNFVEQKQQESIDTTVQFDQVDTYNFQDGEWAATSNDFIFAGGSNLIPPDLPPLNVNPNYLTMGTRICAYLMLAVGISLAIGSAIWTCCHWETRVVRASQPFFLYVICMGALVLLFSILPATVDPSWASVDACSLACNFIPWLVSLGFSLIFSALYTKTYRANKILNNTMAFKRITVTVVDVVRPMVGMLSANILMLSLMAALEPLKWEIHVVSTDSLRGVPDETYGRCSWEDQLPYLIPLVVINFGTLCVALLQAYHARHLSTEFAESKYIFRALSSILGITFVCGPVMLLANDNPNASIFVGCGIVFVTSTSTLLWIFVPKIQFSRAPAIPRVQVSGLDYDQHTIDSTDSLAGSTTHQVQGERILSKLSQRQLIFKNSDLNRELCELKRDLELMQASNAGAPAEEAITQVTDLEVSDESS